VIRVLLVDEDVLVRSGLRMTLAAAEEIEVVGEAVDATVVGDDDDALGHERRNRNAKPPVAPAGQRTPPDVGDGEKERQRNYPVEGAKGACRCRQRWVCHSGSITVDDCAVHERRCCFPYKVGAGRFRAPSLSQMSARSIASPTLAKVALWKGTTRESGYHMPG